MSIVSIPDINARLLDLGDKQLEVDRYSVADAITALAGGGQTAPALYNHYNRVTTVATAADSVRLPPAIKGTLPILVANAAAANSMNVFPSTGDSINLLSANTAFAQAAGVSRMYVCFATGVWTAF